MGYGYVLLFALGWGIISLSKSSSAPYYQYVDLEKSCNSSVILECPVPETGRAGTFRYFLIYMLPLGLCSFEATLAHNCGGWTDRYKFYLNIRKLDLPANDYLKIYDAGLTYNFIKHLTGNHTAAVNPASVAQAVTEYFPIPSVKFEYFRSSSTATNFHDALIDFVVVEERPGSHSGYCNAVSGYVNSNFLCDTAGWVDRVNCPSSYIDSTVTGLNRLAGDNAISSRRHRHRLGVQRPSDQPLPPFQ
ncbi:uncharacterized protein LOC129596543 [Paramacrobiotus metropolitanus]|uniref:uncharacterized protein LOC129596543 n=1 Tax=Paramacrobiotus metropolitanus TaxID=2943436 RepID=UPI002445F3D6|nr:uncharacterized protein LOC129596543 [Paramacrobiotus metropolitanus]